MKLTPEQEQIIHSSGNIKINAVAGSGKTTTVIEYAKSRPADSKILYLAFNKSVRLEATKKMQAHGLNNVRVETAHSLAYKQVVYANNYTVRSQGYKTNEIVSILGLEANGDKHAVFIIANHVNKLIAYFCNSNKQKVQELNYLETVTDVLAKKFVTSFNQYIVQQARLLLAKMDKGEIDITHDFYLKKFQLVQPELDFDYILFDEGQDASQAMLDVFLRQKATKVIVGDTHQQIYGWRYAVNSLEQVNYINYTLSASFRFGNDIANLAKELLQLKKIINKETSLSIVGKGNSKKLHSKAIIARTNLGLLLKAIELVTQNKKIKHIYFEGNFNSYTYADEGASLYDVLNLQNNKKDMVKDELIKAMSDMDELEDYIEKTEDVQLGMMLEIVKEYGNDIYDIIKNIKEKHVPNDEKEKAEYIFSTVHRCKGMEYDQVELVNDFINEKKLENKLREDRAEGKEPDFTKLNEEINLLYVAVTRTKNKLIIPETLMPKDFAPSVNIDVMKVLTKEDKKIAKEIANKPKAYRASMHNDKADWFDDHKAMPKESLLPWTVSQDKKLRLFCDNGVSVSDIAKHFDRTPGAIIARMKKLDLS